MTGVSRSVTVASPLMWRSSVRKKRRHATPDMERFAQSRANRQKTLRKMSVTLRHRNGKVFRLGDTDMARKTQFIPVGG